VNLLAVDIGNTHITLGGFRGENLASTWRITSTPPRTADEYGSILLPLLVRSGFPTDRMILSSVVPSLEAEWIIVGEEVLEVETRNVGSEKLNLMPLSVDHPEEVGVDRVVGSWAATKLYSAPLIVIDFGTATTFDVVGPEGDYQGGIILPGLLWGAEILAERTALLPHVTLKKPAHVIGTNTVDCIRSGLYYGWLDMTRALVARLKAELGQEAPVVTTGGLCDAFGDDDDFSDYREPTLILEGLRMVDADFYTPAD